MRILVAGASGAVGRRLVPMLVERGHEVTGTTRGNVAVVRGLGADPVVLDALDAGQVNRVVADAKPEVVVHQLTALSGEPDLRHFDEFFEPTNRLRVEGTDHLLWAAASTGVRRMVAQSYTGWTNPRTGGPVKTEEDGLDPDPTPASRTTLAAIAHLESAVTSTAPIEGVVLRYGNLYGPGNAISTGGQLVEMIQKRRLPVVGGGNGIWSFIHVDDAARVTVTAIEGDRSGIFNIVDDEPAPVREWLPYLARVIGAKPPMRVPAWLVRPLLGPHAVAMMTTARGSDNAKARRELAWTPMYPSWRQGFRDGLD
jgi:nucleoside-diphosphate-sugar epimerase